ncbi:aldolase [Violaceomyces palustris]|uniref:Aldolase n=1 Tax=Violaceomyces palustris TaxID=1673888 RepID=A0ACD0NWR2_9BASI|nr:aldolase [Violaceomyces palustris]
MNVTETRSEDENVMLQIKGGENDPSPPPPSILLIGMRGAGKTTLGRLAAHHLNLTFIDADQLFIQENRGMTPPQYVKSFGWEQFRGEETRILKDLVKRIQVGERLVGSVIHIYREVEMVLKESSRKGGRPAPSWAQTSQEVWERRRPWLRQCSSHEFVNFSEPPPLPQEEEVAGLEDQLMVEEELRQRLRFEAVERDFMRFLTRILEPYKSSITPLEKLGISDERDMDQRKRSYLATLPFSDLHPFVGQLPMAMTGASAVEIRADLFVDPTPVSERENPSLSFISEQIGLLRRNVPDLPIVFTLRTPTQGGVCVLPEESLYLSLKHALKLGVDFMDLEQGFNQKLCQNLVSDAKERSTSVIVSWRDKRSPKEGGFSWSSPTSTEIFRRAVELGADIVKMVGTAGEIQDNFALRTFASERGTTATTGPVVPLCAYNMGAKGRISRFLNPVLASVTHDLAKEGTRNVVGAPSMTFREMQQALHLCGMLAKKTFYCIRHREDARSLARTDRMSKWFSDYGLPYSIKEITLPLLPADARGGLCERIQSIRTEDQTFSGLCIVRGGEDEVLATEFSKLVEDHFSTSSSSPHHLQHARAPIDTLAMRSDKDDWVGSHTLTEALTSNISRKLSPSNATRRGTWASVICSSRQKGGRETLDSILTSLRSNGLKDVVVSESVRKACESIEARSSQPLDSQVQGGSVGETGSQKYWDRSPCIVIGVGQIHQGGTGKVGRGGEGTSEKEDLAQLLSSPSGGLALHIGVEKNGGGSIEGREGTLGTEKKEPWQELHQPALSSLEQAVSEESRRRRGWVWISNRELELEIDMQRFLAWTGRRYCV